jgi:hypothetical protein
LVRSAGRRISSWLLQVGKGVAGRNIPLKGVSARGLLLPAAGKGNFSTL